MSPGEKRRRLSRRLRQRAAYAEALAIVKGTGATCRSCLHFEKMPDSKSNYCDLDSDSGGYSIVTPEHVCPRHKQREADHTT